MASGTHRSRGCRYDDARATARAEALAWVTSAWRSEQMVRALEDACEEIRDADRG